ncbi:E3 UFM1-protein ligase 1-like [Biomphalaria glabrata]|uniref:E3 UFM1-protein ligase 1-like n=1 Tax=Biomphalaria glabrata TaxID=6526 RepID=A0A9W2YEM4_BIOGL|nr:E3 UFM1-protein ligase 1-like [Biomphalaria glabrata]
MADWEEVRRLAADFQKVQLSSAKQKLSERNVIEIVSKLVELHLIDVLYTSDGKTYLTHEQLAKEIRDELIYNAGRINLVDLQQLLNVDYSHIEAKVNDMVKHDGHLTLVLGQLIDNSYRERLADEINDLLQEKGHVTIIELTKSYDLPADFIREVIDYYLGKRIKGQIDSYERDIVFTNAFVNRMKAQIRGALSAVTVPTTIGPVRQSVGCQEHLFHSILEELISSGCLAGSLSGSRQDKSQFLPDIYTRTQSDWVDSFYKQNGYLEYDAMTRLGISDPKGYIKKKFKSEPIVFLSSCCVGPGISEQVSYTVDENLNLGGWVDILTVLPSVLSRKDASDLLASCLKAKGNVIVCDSTIVASEKLVSQSMPAFSEIMTEKAEKAAKSHMSVLTSEPGPTSQGSVKITGLDDGSSAREDKKEQRRKKAATAGSSKKEGTGGREVKMKSTKKKGKGREVEEESEEEAPTQPAAKGKATKETAQEQRFMSVNEIQEVLKKQPHLKECPSQLLTEIATQLHRPLTRQYQEVAKSIFIKSSGTDRKKTAVEVQDKINGLWVNTHLFEKGIKLFEEAVQINLVKHLLKTVCSDLANTVVLALASDNMVSVTSEENLTPEARLRLISTLPKESQDPLSRLHVTLNGHSLEDFFHQLELLCGPHHLGILLKKPDKRKERQLVFNHRLSLVEQLKTETDPAMGLHLAVVLLFQTMTQCMLHIPGRLVPSVIHHLTSLVDAEKMAVLTQMQDLIVKQHKMRSDQEHHDNELEDQVTKEMNTLLASVKDIALNTKKASAAAED